MEQTACGVVWAATPPPPRHYVEEYLRMGALLASTHLFGEGRTERYRYTLLQALRLAPRYIPDTDPQLGFHSLGKNI